MKYITYYGYATPIVMLIYQLFIQLATLKISNQFKIFLDLKYFQITPSDPAEGKDKERTETTPAEEAQQGTVNVK